MLSDILINEYSIVKKLKNLELNKAHGLDGFVPRLLTETATVLQVISHNFIVPIIINVQL